jgi:hypothetical protein
VTNYPRNKDTNLETLIYVEIPTNDSSTPDKIPGATLLAIITDGKSRIRSHIGHDLGSVKSGQTLSGSDEKEMDNELNNIMIPIAFFLLLAIALICWLLHRAR